MVRKNGGNGLVIAVVAVFTVVSVLGLGASGQEEGDAEGRAVTINLGVGDPIQSSVGVTAQYFADRVAEVTDGMVNVEVFPDGVTPTDD